MTKTIITGALLAVSLFVTGCGTPKQTEWSQAAPAETPPTGISSTKAQGKTEKLEKFISIEVDVLAADIQIVPGEDWSVSYNLSEKEPLKRFGVEGDTLYVETAFDAEKYFDRTGDWFVTVTVPEDSTLSEVELNTISGNVELRGISCESGELHSTSGTVDAEESTVNELELDSASGEISAVKLTADTLEAKTVSSDICIEGDFGELETTTVSGDTEVSGTISDSGSLKSTSGEIGLRVSHDIAVQADRIGTITVNGEQKSCPAQCGSGVPVEVKTVSGEVTIETKASR